MAAEALDDGVRASTVELVEIQEVDRLLASGETSAFSASELDFAHARADPARRLAARLAAKRAAIRLLGPELAPRDFEVLRDEHGPPSLRLSARARERLAALGAARLLVSLTHERRHAAALVALLEDA
jgi:holo-[acyl-carrier protein] synthase